MAKSVTSAFSEFLRDSVNLDPSDTQKARNSRDNLIGNLNSFSGHDGFFVIYDSKNLKFGLFARRTKIRPIDDIDIILCFSAEETRKYVETSSGIDIIASENDKQNQLFEFNQGY